MVTDAQVERWRAAVRTALDAWVENADPTLGRDVAEFVASGDAGPDLIERLTAVGGIKTWETLPRDDRLKDAHALLHTMPARVRLRWAEIVLLLKRYTLTLAPIAGGDAIENLICDLVGEWSSLERNFPDLPVGYDTLDEMVVAAGGRSGELLAAAFSRAADRPSGWMWPTRNILLSTRGYAAAVVRHAAELAPLAAAQTGEDIRERVLDLLEPLDGTALAAFADTLATFMVEATGNVAVRAERLCGRCDRAALFAAFQRQVSGPPARRAAALRAAWRYADIDADRQWATATAQSDRAPSVRLIVDEWRDAAAPIIPIPDPGPGWPVVDPTPVRPALERLFAQLNSIVVGNDWGGSPPPLMGAEDLLTVETMLRAGRAPDRKNPWPRFANYRMRDAIREFAEAEHVDMVVLLVVCHYLRDHPFDFYEFADAVHAKLGGPSLAELAGLLGHLTEQADTGLVYHYAKGNIGQGWPSADVLPFLTANAQYLADRAMNASPHIESPKVYWDLLAELPVLPPDAADALFPAALGPKTSNRAQAQRVLAKAPDRRARIYTALADGRVKVRLAAAQWIAHTADHADVPRLETCLRIETDDRVRGALLGALTAAGRPAADYLTPEHLIAEAETALRKDAPAGLSWLLWERVPTMRWEQGLAPVPASVVRWLVIKACEANDPAPDGGLRHHLALFAAEDRFALGDFLIDAWTTADEYAFHSRQTAQQTVSAIKSKGVLAVVAACASPNAPTLAEEFLRSFDTARMAQCSALLTMLGHIDSVDAVRVLTSVAYRSKSARLIEEAAAQLAELPARWGWSADEAADRTVPYVGFDNAGRLQLSYGPEPYFAVLQADLSITVYDGDGNPCTKGDLAGPYKTVPRAYLARARKLLAPVVTAQTARLAEAMHRQRRWSVAEFERYVLGHPVLSRLARRLVWVAETDCGPTLFRPLGATAGPAGTVTVRVAGDADMTAEQAAGWRAVINAGDAPQLFDQG